MISFLWRKMWKNKWIMACLLIGNLLLVGIVAATPLYINATMRRVLHQDMRAFQVENGTHPALMSLQFMFNSAGINDRVRLYLESANYLAPGIANDMGVPIASTIRQDTMVGWMAMPYPAREAFVQTRTLHLTGVGGMFDNIQILHGRLPASYLVDGNIVEAIVTEQALLTNSLLLGDMLEVRNVLNVGTYYVHIVGIYDLAEGSDEFWGATTIDHHRHNILVSDFLIRSHFIFNYVSDYRINTTWIHLLDYRDMTSRDAAHYIDTIAYYTEFFNDARMWDFHVNFGETIMYFTQRADRLAVTLWVLQVPIYVILAFYIYMVSRQILQLEQNEISILKSRGASRKQILGIYGLQGLFVAAVCYPAGLAIGVFLCRMLGASNGFLELVQRAAIIVEITPDALLFAGIAMSVSFITMFIPVVRFSKVGIVAHKRSRSGKIQKPVWQRFFLDVLCLGISLYGLHNFNTQREVMATMVRTAQSVDPLLFLSSSLFIMGLGLFCLRIFPYIVGLVFYLGKRFWSPSAYASLIKVMRSSGEEQFIMIFLLFTLSVGTFSAQAARTINLNNDHQIMYLSGADLTFRENWRREGGQAVTALDDDGNIVAMPTGVRFYEPDFERFTGFDEIDAITRVQQQYVQISHAESPPLNDVVLMGVETYTFGNTMWFRDDLLRVHINYFLNILASRGDGLLLSDNLRTVNGIKTGDTVQFTDAYARTTRGVVVGFVDHWPGFAPVQRVELDGQVLEVNNSLVVANLGFLQSHMGLYPYHVWMRTNSDSNRFFYDFADENRINFIAFGDAKAALVESRSDPVLQGTNGVLTVGFIVTLLVCFTGFLIYWILSIRSRILQFSIFRAMGMSMKSLAAILLNEQLFITFTAIVLGAFVGEVTARLFVPLIQISYTAADQVIPLKIVAQARDYGNLYSVVGIMVVLCFIVLAWYVSRIKIAQALKLGED
ncbi:MAG: ABC transporter permease [Defluviitaleaceae bacterium]|nr:ABC transporter permease [Defluviitaleaceae bacterium]